MTNEKSEFITTRLVLHPGGDLFRTRWDDDNRGESGYLGLNVTDQAAACLFEVIELTPEICLRDVFALVARVPFLKELLHHHRIDQLLDEVDKASKQLAEPTPQDFEFLELSWIWHITPETRAYSNMKSPYLHAVGFIQEQDVMGDDDSFLCRAGGRFDHPTPWSDPISSLLDLPLRLEKALWLAEVGSFGLHVKNVEMIGSCETTLGQMLEGLFSGLAHAARNSVSKKAEDV